MAEEMDTNDAAEDGNTSDGANGEKPNAESTADAAGGDAPSGGNEKKFTQEDVDKIAGRIRAQSKVDVAEIEKAAIQKARREAEEKQLLEDKNYQELALRREQEMLEAKEKLAQYERITKVDELLDKREIRDPSLRTLFRKIPGELKELDADLTAHRQAFDAAVEAEVSKRLDVSTPPQANKEAEKKQIKDMTPEEWQAEKILRGIAYAS